MQWREISVHTTTEGADLVSGVLMELGALGTEIKDRNDVPDPDKPGVYWELYDKKLLENMPEDVVVKGWFEQDSDVDETVAALKEQLQMYAAMDLGVDLGSLKIDQDNVKDEDWAEEWKKYYKPFRIGSHLVVKPTWEDYAVQPDDLVIELDPGMAFGTGTHETTNMCMQLLERYLADGMRVMDVGTGSGILAIAAAKLNAKDILAIDIDPDAVKVAKENVALNGVEEQIRVVVGDLCKSEAMPCDLAVANIVADAICMLAGPMTRHLEKDGLLICSGIIREKEQQVMDAALEAGYTLHDRIEKGEWVALCLKNEAE